MSKSKSLLRPSVLLRTMCPVSPSHCAYKKGRGREREIYGELEDHLSSLSIQTFGSRTLEQAACRRSEGGPCKKRGSLKAHGITTSEDQQVV